MTAETEPVHQVDPQIQVDPASRWSVRAHSISECVEKLSEVWTSAAIQTEAPDVSQDALERAKGDPRLAPNMTDRSSVRVRTRTSVLTLVVVAPRPETTERALAAINHLNRLHPSRAIVISPGDPDGPSTTDAHIYAECRLSDNSSAEICTEQILVKTGGELAQHLSRVVAPLLIHDLPVVLWWPDDPPFGSKQFTDVVDTADRLLVDSGTFHEDGGERLAGLATVVAGGVAVTDIGWLRLSLWRELLAGLFDHPLLTRELDHIKSVRIDIARPTDTLRVSRAAFYLGWLAARLGWETARPLAPRGGESDELRGAFRLGRREIAVEIHPVRATLDGAKRAPGSLVRVDIEAARPKAQVRARVTRQSDHLLATADWNGAQVTRRAGRLEPFDETPFIAEALERPGLDRSFEQALIRAVRLLGG
ncbi:MAG TPA: glucose-6-phosphate dehydrogenase assembly protein OpcA [Candidatus Limnocylindria bacterium]|nr:glucose-6-phosphate dehydrogenase assembly protein OpcA [Candidatus Limnocylindria bacterium]